MISCCWLISPHHPEYQTKTREITQYMSREAEERWMTHKWQWTCMDMTEHTGNWFQVLPCSYHGETKDTVTKTRHGYESILRTELTNEGFMGRENGGPWEKNGGKNPLHWKKWLGKSPPDPCLFDVLEGRHFPFCHSCLQILVLKWFPIATAKLCTDCSSK